LIALEPVVDQSASSPRGRQVDGAIKRTHGRLGIWPRKPIAGTGYGSAEMLARLSHRRGTEPHIPVFEQRRDLLAK
jgi:tRNA A58 N-methylase Trm61